MNRKWTLALLIICFAIGLTVFPAAGKAEAAEQSALATTFPIYQIVRNVAQGRDGLTVDLMLPSQLGCPHDLHYSGDQHHDHGHHHHHAGVNPHLFASPRMTAKLAMNIAAELSKVDPDGAAAYFKNARIYAEAMNKLADDMAALGKRLKNHRIVQPHGVFDYLARDMGLEIVAVTQAHGQEPSASEMMQLVKTIKEKGAGAIFTEPRYPEKIGKALSKETGVPVAMLDPAATGPENAPLTYYETVMRQNMKTLESTLGVK